MIKDDISVKELRERLVRLRISEECYSLGEYKEEALCLEKTQNSWIIYEGERGNRYNLAEYESEEDACVAFLVRIKEFA